MRGLFLGIPALVLVAAPALGEDIAKARQLFAKGLEQEESGQWADALATFREVAAIRTNHIVRFHIALCLEKTGKLAQAVEQFALAKAQAEKEGGTDAELTVANAKKHLDVLRIRVPAVRVSKPSVAGARLSVDGEAASFDAAIPLDPGTHAIVVEAPEHERFERSVTLVDGTIVPVGVEPKLVPLPKGDKPKANPIATTDVPAPDRTWTWVLGGVGVASLAGAGVFYGLRASALHDVESTCDVNGANCDPSKRSLDDRGRTYTIAGNVLLGVGIASVGAAITIAALSPARGPTVALIPSPTAMLMRLTF